MRGTGQGIGVMGIISYHLSRMYCVPDFILILTMMLEGAGITLVYR